MWHGTDTKFAPAHRAVWVLAPSILPCCAGAYDGSAPAAVARTDETPKYMTDTPNLGPFHAASRERRPNNAIRIHSREGLEHHHSTDDEACTRGVSSVVTCARDHCLSRTLTFERGGRGWGAT